MGELSEVLTAITKGVGRAAETYANTNSAAAAKANGVSQGAQAAQAAFNGGQAALANQIGDARMYQQQAFNSGQAQMANAFTAEMWEKTAAWNEMMWEKQAEFNRQEAQKNRDWQTEMANTAYQRAVTDMKAAGINPALASGATPIMPSGGAASVGSASMGSAAGQAASAGLLGADSANISSYSGQMETMNNTMALLSAAMAGMTSAAQAMQTLGADKNDFAKFIMEIVSGQWEKTGDRLKQNIKNYVETAKTKMDIWRHSNR